MSSCSSCGASVVWCRNEKTGKLAPIDAMPCPEGNIFVTDCPETGADLYRIAEPGELGDMKHTSHFATCPNAKAHRKPRASYTPPAVVETRKVSFDDVKREFEEAKEEES